MVRLRQLLTWYRKLCKLVSIPLWCDCDLPATFSGFAKARSFNPTMVRLRLESFFPKFFEARQFQSHYGAIATVEAIARGAWEMLSFNPTMVRLRRLHKCGCTKHIQRFQSHYGAIATCRRKLGTLSPKTFQSHYGAIATKGILSC